MAIGRIAHLAALWSAAKEGWVARMLTYLYATFGFVSFVVEQLSPETRAAWERVFLLPNIVPEWPLTVWIAVALVVLTVGVFEGSYILHRRDSASIATYQANDPRIVITGAEAHDLNPYRLYFTARVENPGEPTVFRAWSVLVAFSNGTVLNPQIIGDGSFACRSYEIGANGQSSAVSHDVTPLRSGGIADALFHLHFPQALFALPLDEATQFTLQCLTIRNVQIEASARVRVAEPQYVLPPDDPNIVDKVLGLPVDPQRTNADRLPMARRLLAELGETASAQERDKQRLSSVARALMLLSRAVNGMTEEYELDWLARLAALKRAGIRVDG